MGHHLQLGHIHKLSVSVCLYDIDTPVWSNGNVFDHRSLPPMFETRPGHIWKVFRLSLCLITFGSRSAHLAYHVHKSGHKTSIVIIIIIIIIMTLIQRTDRWLADIVHG